MVHWTFHTDTSHISVIYDPRLMPAGDSPHQVGLSQTGPVCVCSTVWSLWLISPVRPPPAFFHQLTAKFPTDCCRFPAEEWLMNLLMRAGCLPLSGAHPVFISPTLTVLCSVYLNIIACFITTSPLRATHIPLTSFTGSAGLHYVCKYFPCQR